MGAKQRRWQRPGPLPPEAAAHGGSQVGGLLPLPCSIRRWSGSRQGVPRLPPAATGSTTPPARGTESGQLVTRRARRTPPTSAPKAEDLPEGGWEKPPSFPEQSTPKVQAKKKESKGLTADNLYTTCLAQGHHLPVCSSSLTVRMDSTSLFPATYSSLCGTPRSTGGSLGLTNPRAWNPRSCPHRGGSQARTRPARRETPRQPPPRRPSTHPVAGMALSPPSSPLDRSSSTISLSSTKRLSVGGCVIQRDFISPASSMF
jgi:hypothetical protein